MARASDHNLSSNDVIATAADRQYVLEKAGPKGRSDLSDGVMEILNTLDEHARLVRKALANG